MSKRSGWSETRRRRAALLLLLAAFAIGLSACGGSDEEATGASSNSDSNSLELIYVTSNPSSEPTGAIIHNGMAAAAEDLGVDAEYRSTKSLEFTPTELKRLLDQAIASKPDGLIVTDPDPEALNGTIEKATEAGIPVVLSSTGAGEAEKVGALTYVGNDEVATGETGGELLGEAGATHALVITIPPGVPFVEQRESGFEKGFPGKVTTLAVEDFSDVTATTNAVLAALQKDSSIDGVFSMGSALSPAELAAQKQVGERANEISWATIDIGPQVLEAIQDGTFEFALDQQPYLQGYLPVLYLDQYLELGLDPVQAEVPTGPAVVNDENAEQIEELAGAKVR